MDLWRRSVVVEEGCLCGRGTWLLGKVVVVEEEGGCRGKKWL